MHVVVVAVSRSACVYLSSMYLFCNNTAVRSRSCIHCRCFSLLLTYFKCGQFNSPSSAFNGRAHRQTDRQTLRTYVHTDNSFLVFFFFFFFWIEVVPRAGQDEQQQQRQQQQRQQRPRGHEQTCKYFFFSSCLSWLPASYILTDLGTLK